MRNTWNQFLANNTLPHGVVAGAANVMPREWQRAWQVCRAGEAANDRSLPHRDGGVSRGHRICPRGQNLSADDRLHQGRALPSRRDFQRRGCRRNTGPRRECKGANTCGASTRCTGGPCVMLEPEWQSHWTRRRQISAREFSKPETSGCRRPNSMPSAAAAWWWISSSAPRASSAPKKKSCLIPGAMELPLNRRRRRRGSESSWVGASAGARGRHLRQDGRRSLRRNFTRRDESRSASVHHLTLDGSASSFATIFVDAEGNRAIYMVRGATAELKPAEIRRRHAAFIRNAHLVSTEISQLPLATVIATFDFRACAFDTHCARCRCAAFRRLSSARHTSGTRTCAEARNRAQTGQSRRPRAFRRRSRSSQNGRSDSHTVRQPRRCDYRRRTRMCDLRARDRASGARDFGCAKSMRPVPGTPSWERCWRVSAGACRGKQSGGLGNAAGAVCITRLGAFPERLDLREEILKHYGEALPECATAPRIATSRRIQRPRSGRGGRAISSIQRWLNWSRCGARSIFAQFRARWR